MGTGGKENINLVFESEEAHRRDKKYGERTQIRDLESHDTIRTPYDGVVPTLVPKSGRVWVEQTSSAEWYFYHTHRSRKK